MGTFNRKISLCTQRVPHSFSEDGSIRYGDAIVLAHKQTKGSLACDPFTTAGFEGNEYAVSVCESSESMARNTFIIRREDGGGDGELVCWGVPFRLQANPSLRVDDRSGMLQAPLYLASNLKNERKASPMSNKQLVYMTAKPSYSTVWFAQRPATSKDSGADRMLSKGEPVVAGEEIILQHCATKELLSSDTKYNSVTDFGVEFEISCHTNTVHGKISVLGGEFSGQRTSQTNVKPEMNQNIFAFVTSDDPSLAVEDRNLPPPLTAEGLIAKVLSVLRSRSKNAIRNLKSAFRAMDEAGDFKLDKEDLKWGLRDLGVEMDNEQFNILFGYFDKTGDGIVSLTEFISAVRGPMSEARVSVVMKAYDVLDKDGSGMVTVDDVLAAYNLASDPMVAEGVKSAEEAAKEFMSMWETTADGMVTKEEFVEYYNDLSAEIDSDEEFETILQAAWGF